MATKTQRLSIDLERNEELARIVADLEPGSKLDAVLSIVARDDKTLTVEVEEVVDRDGDAEDDEDETEEDAEEESDPDESPAMKFMRGNHG